ncbi:MAG: gamma-glutamylcyclotransferase family protein [Myxococcota bacterium]
MLLFVYGTLMRGERAHHLLKKTAFITDDETPPTYKLLDLGEYPGLATEGTDAVVGEVFEVPAALLRSLDRYEGDEYVRVSIPLASGRIVETYVLRTRRDEPAIESGNWRSRQSYIHR